MQVVMRRKGIVLKAVWDGIAKPDNRQSQHWIRTNPDAPESVAPWLAPVRGAHLLTPTVSNVAQSTSRAYASAHTAAVLRTGTKWGSLPAAALTAGTSRANVGVRQIIAAGRSNGVYAAPVTGASNQARSVAAPTVALGKQTVDDVVLVAYAAVFNMFSVGAPPEIRNAQGGMRVPFLNSAALTTTVGPQQQGSSKSLSLLSLTLPLPQNATVSKLAAHGAPNFFANRVAQSSSPTPKASGGLSSGTVVLLAPFPDGSLFEPQDSELNHSPPPTPINQFETVFVPAAGGEHGFWTCGPLPTHFASLDWAPEHDPEVRRRHAA